MEPRDIKNIEADLARINAEVNELTETRRKADQAIRTKNHDLKRLTAELLEAQRVLLAGKKK